MRAIILAAGEGKRLAPMGWDKPKCLLEIAGRTLLDHLMTSIVPHGISEAVVVVGYRRRSVEEAVEGHPTASRIIVNEEYARTNTINSLWLAREYLDDDFLYFNADVMFDAGVIALLLACEHSALAVDTKACGEEEVKVITDSTGRILQIGKDLPPEACLGEFIGVGRFRRSASRPLLESLRRYNKELKSKNLFFESAVNDITGTEVFAAVALGDLRAVEIDTPEDYELARQLWPA